MDKEKVIKGLECHQIDKDHRINCSDCPYHCDEFMNGLNELHKDAIALLKEQEAVEPIIEDETIQIVRCGQCGTELQPLRNYCHECGKAVKWDG